MNTGVSSITRLRRGAGLLLEMDYAASEMEDLATWNYDHPDILELKMEDLTARPYEGFIEIFEFLDLLDDDAGAYDFKQHMRAFGHIIGNHLSRKHWLFTSLHRPTPVSGTMLLGCVYDHRFEKKAGGREKGKADAKSHYRKGKAGDWINQFSPEHVAAFKDKFGPLVVKLGYEETNDWNTIADSHVASFDSQ